MRSNLSSYLSYYLYEKLNVKNFANKTVIKHNRSQINSRQLWLFHFAHCKYKCILWFCWCRIELKNLLNFIINAMYICFNWWINECHLHIMAITLIQNIFQILWYILAPISRVISHPWNQGESVKRIRIRIANRIVQLSNLLAREIRTL